MEMIENIFNMALEINRVYFNHRITKFELTLNGLCVNLLIYGIPHTCVFDFNEEEVFEDMA